MSESNDSDSTGEWVFVTTEEKPQEVSALLTGSCLQTERSSANNLSEIQMEPSSQEDSMATELQEHDDMYLTSTKADDESSVGSKDSNVSSEVDIIDEEDDGNIASLESSLSSHLSSFSLANPSIIGIDSESLGSKGVEIIHEDLSENSVNLQQDELPSDVELQAGVRHYVHTPNTRLNVTLNLVLALAVATVIGLGIGNFLGRPGHVDVKQVSYGEVLKLKQLQDELLNCLEHQHHPVSKSRLCYENIDYWKEKFQKFLDENAGFQEFIQVVHSDMRSKNNKADEAVRFCSSEAKDEFYKLKLDLILKQMEHLQLLKSFEEVKHQELQSQERLKELEEENVELKVKLDFREEEPLIVELENKVKLLHLENKELKDKLEDENEEDELIKILEKRVRGLDAENLELRETLKKLQNELQVINNDVLQQYSLKDNEMSNVNEKSGNKVSFDLKLNTVRQRINHLIAENEELKAVVARLRYSEPILKFEDEPLPAKHAEKDNTLQINQDELHPSSEKSTSQQDLSAPAASKNSALDDSVLISLKEQLENLRNSLSTEVNETRKWKKLFESIVNRFNESENDKNKEQWWSQKLKHSLDSLQEVFFDVQHNLTDKWIDFQNFTESSGFQKYVSQSKKAVKKVTEMLQHTIKKTRKVGKKMLEKHVSLEINFEKVKEKVWDIVNGLEKKWSDVKEKWFQEMGMKVELSDNGIQHNDNHATAPNFEDGTSKSEFHSGKDEKNINRRHKSKSAKGDWVFRRAEDREMHHKKLEEEYRNDWYMRSARGRSLRRKKNSEVDES